MLSGSVGQSVGPFKSIGALNSHFPILTGPRSRNGHPPVASSVGKCVFDVRSKVSAQLSIAEILEFNCNSHSTAFYRPEGSPFVVQTREG